MNKNVLISYKWDPERGENRWLFWLEKKLQAQGFQVTMSPLHEPRSTTENWVRDIQTIYSINDKNIYFVNHDPGCLTILKYLEYLSGTPINDPVLLIAGLYKKAPQFEGQSQSNYLRLESPKEVAVFKGSTMGNIDAKLVILYSNSPQTLESNEQRKRLSI